MNDETSSRPKTVGVMVGPTGLGAFSDVLATPPRSINSSAHVEPIPPPVSRLAKLYHNLGSKGELRPIRRARTSRPAGMSGRQWKKLRKGNKE